MTSDDKALVKRLRDESIVGMPMENEAADRIETLNAMLKAAEESLGDQLAARKEQADRIEAQAAEIEELKSWKAAEDAHHHKLRAEIERLREALALFGGEAAIEAKQLFIRMTAAAKCSGKRKELAERHCEASRKAAIARAALGETE